MKKRIKFLTFISLGFLTSIGAVTSCSTSWAHWNPKNNGPSTFDFYNDIPLPNQWKVRPLSTLENSWNSSTNTLDISYLHNQYELFSMIGHITQIRQDKMQSIDSYWKYKDNSSQKIPWKGLKTYIGNLNTSTIIKIKEGQISYGSISINFDDDKSKLKNGFQNYNNSDVDTKKGHGTASGEYFHSARKYDVEFNGLTPQGLPKDFSEVAAAGSNLINNRTVSALLQIDGEFALRLSKLVNIPKNAFLGFTGFMVTMDKFFNDFINNAGFNKWIKDNDVNFAVTPTGKINTNPPTLAVSFKGYIIEQMLE